MRENLEPIQASPELGLTAEQVEQRIAAGWVSGEPAETGKTDRQIVLSHCFTFFNLIFLVLAVMLLVARS